MVYIRHAQSIISSLPQKMDRTAINTSSTIAKVLYTLAVAIHPIEIGNALTAMRLLSKGEVAKLFQ
jgi:hypothetical protein